MSASLATVSYIGATILFILSLGGLSNPETARRGNLYGMVGMAHRRARHRVRPARHAGRLSPGSSARWWSAARSASIAARKVQMTQMPELVALMHSLVGLAAVLVGFASYIDPSRPRISTGAEKTIHEVEIYIGILIGAVTFSGSVIAFGKLSGKIGGKPLLLPGRHWLNLAGLLVGDLVRPRSSCMRRPIEAGMMPLIVMTVIALLFGMHMVMAIGGADMPVVVSMLNSYSGWAAAATGFMLSQRPADRHRRAGRLHRRDPVVHHVPRDEPQLHQRHRRRLRHRRRRARRPRAARSRPARSSPISAAETAELLREAKSVDHRAGLRHGGGAGAAHGVRDHQAACATRASTCASASIRWPAACRAT